MDEYCIVAPERNKRPSAFRPAKPEPDASKTCPFCPGNEEMTPPANAVYTDQGVLADGARRVRNWRSRVFPNLFAAMGPLPAPPTAEWIALPGYGFHEVIVDSPIHNTGMADLGNEQIELILEVYKDRYSYYRKMKGLSYISVFKNWGDAAGASMSHAHSQIIAIPIMPPQIKHEMLAQSLASFCLYCEIAEREMASSRLIAKNDAWILIAPFYSQAPYETWILPRDHISNLEDMNESQQRELAGILGDALRRLKILLDDPPFNCMVFQLPLDYHLNIRIHPALTKIAGFERSTGIYINPVPPEQAASDLRLA